MRVLSPLGAGLLLQLIACIGCSLPAISRDKENSSTVDGLEATQGEDAGSTGVSSGKVDTSHVESASSSDERSTANVVKDDGGLRVVASDAGTNEPPVHTVEPRSDAGTGTADSAVSDSPRTDAHLVVDAGGNIIVEAASDAGEFDAEVIDGPVTEAGLECTATDGRCDPTGACSKDTCQFDTSGKSCAFTPTRAVPFTCVIAGDALDFSPCDLDDACKPGSVCVADTFIGRDTNDNPVPRRSGSMCRPACHTNEDCAEGDWCQQATDDNNQAIPDLRVCHRYCQEPAQCYAEPVSADIRCTPRDTLLGLEQSECSRKPNNLLPPKPADTNATDSTAAKAAAVTGEVTTDLASHGLMLLQAAPLQAVRGSDEADSPSYCLSNWDCEAPDALCVENVCRIGCEQSNDCSVGAECLVVDGTSVCSDPCPIDTGAGNSCSINPNCGCSEGETCRVNDDQTMTCSGIGERGYMDWCSTQDHCGDGLSCIAGLCRPMCVPGVSECIPGQGECVLTIKSEAVDTYTCSGDCDPVDPNSSAGGRIRCGTGAVCLPTWDPQMFPHALCVSENPEHGPRAKGGDCSDDVDCASGLGCDAAGTCRHWCRTEADCVSGEHCDVLASIYGAVERLGLDSEDVLGLCQAP